MHVHLNILSIEVFLWKLLSCFCFFFGPWAKDYCPFVGNFLAGLLKLNSESRCHIFREKKFCLWKKYTCFGSFRYWANKFRPLVENFPAGLRQLLSMCPEDIIYERYFSWKKMVCYFFQTLSWMFWSSVESLSARLWKLLSACPYEHFFSLRVF